jgi:predicted RNA-binding protein (virulence factor B family)
VVDPLSFKKRRENNQMIFDYLNKNTEQIVNNYQQNPSNKIKRFTTAKG